MVNDQDGPPMVSSLRNDCEEFMEGPGGSFFLADGGCGMVADMSLSQWLLPEFDHEMALTRALLERVPGERAAWKPHSTSRGLGQLAIHLASLPSWAVPTLKQTELDLSPPGSSGNAPAAWESTAAMLAAFDTHVTAARAALLETSDADMMVTWSLKKGGETVMSMPRIAILRSILLNHMVHHRGQLSVYLRLQDVPLPSMYGPSADTAP